MGDDDLPVGRVGFIGLGNVGGKLAGSLARNGVDLVVSDLDDAKMGGLVQAGAQPAADLTHLASSCDIVITCLPSPTVVASVMEGSGGVIEHLRTEAIWIEMSTTDHLEVRRLGSHVRGRGGDALDCPVSGGCHRAATGNITILAGGRRPTFERVLPLLTFMGYEVIHTGDLGTASMLKVVTNYLATANLISLTEALTTCRALGLNLNVAYEAIARSSGTSFVHETESQVILNGSRDINFTMELVAKDVGLFQRLADSVGVPVELSPLMLEIIGDAMARYGPREWSPNLIRRLEDATGLRVLAPGFPPEIVDELPERRGFEVRLPDRGRQ